MLLCPGDTVVSRSCVTCWHFGQERPGWHLTGCWWLRGCWGADGHCGGDLSFLVGCWGFCPHLQCYKPDHKGRGLVLGKSRGGCAVLVQGHNDFWLSRPWCWSAKG